MSRESTPHPTDSLHVSAIVDRICDRFEVAWQRGEQPRLEDFLSAVSASLAPQLLPELLTLETQLRMMAGAAPSRDELVARFPDFPDVVDAVFSRLANEVNETIVTPAGDLISTAPSVTSSEAPTAHQATAQQVAGFNRYQLREPLGRGAFGTVHAARDLELDRDVAVKMPHRHLSTSAYDAQAYLHEARVLAKLDHEHIVPVYDVDHSPDGTLFVVSKLVRGHDLRQAMQTRRCSHREAAELIATLAEALHYAHEAGLVHRDVKPGNVLIDEAGKPYIADFGLAINIAQTKAGAGAEIVGTLAYMSPEQARGEGSRVDRRSDIFSLGVVFFELLTNRRPFEGHSASELLESIRSTTVESPRRVDRGIPRTLANICLQALAKTPSERFATAKEMAERLRRYLEDAVENPLVRAATFALPLLVISWTSLFMAYYAPWSTEAWSLRFDRLGNAAWPLGTGFVIEGFRSLLFLSIIVFVCGTRFHREAWGLVNLRRQNVHVNAFRLLFLIIGVYFCYTEAMRFLDVSRAPTNLANWAKTQGITTTAEQEWYPYATYLAYSLINYVAGVGLLFVLAAFALSRDCLKLRTAVQHLAASISGATSQIDTCLAFNSFREECRSRCARYLDVLGIVALSVHFEYWIGRFTLTETAYNTMSLGRLLVTSAVLCLVCIGYVYGQGLQRSHMALSAQNYPELNLWNSLNSPWEFLKSLVLGNVSGLLLLSLLIPLIDYRLG